MTLNLALTLLMLQGTRALTTPCHFACPRGTPPDTVCAVDPKVGARLFRGRCLMWEQNHCFSMDFKEINMDECLHNYPEVVNNIFSTNQYRVRPGSFQSQVPGVRLLPRFMTMMNFLNRMAVFTPLPIPIYPGFGNPLLPLPFWPVLVL